MIFLDMDLPNPPFRLKACCESQLVPLEKTSAIYECYYAGGTVTLQTVSSFFNEHYLSRQLRYPRLGKGHSSSKMPQKFPWGVHAWDRNSQPFSKRSGRLCSFSIGMLASRTVGNWAITVLAQFFFLQPRLQESQFQSIIQASTMSNEILNPPKSAQTWKNKDTYITSPATCCVIMFSIQMKNDY